MDRRFRKWILYFGACLGLLVNTSALSQDNTAVTLAESQIQALSEPGYRARQLARWKLEQDPIATIAAIRKTIDSVDFDTGKQLVSILSQFTMHSDVRVNLRAQAALESIANDITGVGRQAADALRAVADIQETKAMEVLTQYGAVIGVPNFTLNGKSLGQLRSELFALHIDERFRGDADVISWIRYLKSIDTIFLEGPKINSQYFDAISQLKGVRFLRLDHIDLPLRDLEKLHGLTKLEHLGLNYVQVDNSFVPTLMRLPISQSLRIFGTRIDQTGELLLAKQLDGVEIFRGNGGFLGIAQSDNSSVVGSTPAGGAAMKAGIIPGDRILSIAGIPVQTFDQVRAELAKHRAGDSIRIQLRRVGKDEVLEITAVLGEQQQ